MCCLKMIDVRPYYRKWFLFLAATKQLYEWYSYHRIIMKFSGVITSDKSDVHAMQMVKVRGQRSRSQRSQPNLTLSGL